MVPKILRQVLCIGDAEQRKGIAGRYESRRKDFEAVEEELESTRAEYVQKYPGGARTCDFVPMT